MSVSQPWPPAAHPVLWLTLGPWYSRPPKSGWRSRSTEVKLWWSWLWPFPLGEERAAKYHRSSWWSRTPAVKSCGPKMHDGEVQSIVSVVGAATAGVFSQQLCSVSFWAKCSVPFLQHCLGFLGRSCFELWPGLVMGRVYILGLFG